MKTVGTILLLVAMYWSIRISAADESIQSHQFTNFFINNSSTLINANSTSLGQSFVNHRSSIHQEILDELKKTYEEIGLRQADQIRAGNENLSWMGGLNSIGLNYQKAFGTFKIFVRRDLSPDISDDERWIVNDQFTIEISASELLSNLRKEGSISITDAKIGAYAGISFRRSYQFIHFAKSYNDGLTTKLDRLFLNFLKFNNLEFIELEEYEILKKEDYLSFNAGAIASIPIQGGISATIGALIEYENLSKLSIQKVGPEDFPLENEQLRISFEKSKSIRTGITSGLHLDFLALLRLSLFQFDFSYALTKAHKANLSLSYSDIEKVRAGGEFSDNLLAFVGGDDYEIEVLAKNIVTLERRTIEQMNSKYMLFLMGGTRDQETQHLEVVSNGVLKNFFKHTYEKVKFNQNLFNRLMSVVTKAFLDWDVSVGRTYQDIKKLQMEYESEEDLIKSKGDLPILEVDENFTLALNREFFVDVLEGKKKTDALKVLDNYAGFDSSIYAMLDIGILQGPVKIKSKFQMGKKAIDYFNALERGQVYKQIESLCSAKPKGFFSWLRSLFYNCKYDLRNKFDRYYLELRVNSISSKTLSACLGKAKKFPSFFRRKLIDKCTLNAHLKPLNVSLRSIPMWRLKSYLQALYDQSQSKLDLYAFFGIGNFFSYGSINAMTNDQLQFLNHFQEGNFNGLGVIDTHLKQESSRSPASVTLD